MSKHKNKTAVGLTVLIAGIAAAVFLSGAAAAQTTAEIGFENDTVDAGESTDLIATNVPSTTPAGAYEVVLDSDSIDSVTISGTSRFNVSTDTSGSEKTVVGYTGNMSGQGGTTTLATVAIDSEATDATLSVNDIVTFSDTAGNEITPRSLGDSTSIAGDTDGGDDDTDGGEDDTNSGSSGTGGAPSGGGGAPASDDDSGPPTVESVQSTLDLATPDADTTTEIADNDPDTAGVSVTPEETESVQSITFDTDSVSGSVEITEYNNPPEQISSEVASSIAGDVNKESDDSGSESTSSSNVQVVSVSDITPTTEAAEDSSATVELTVDRDRVNSPEQLTVVKETYDFDAQETRWAQQETTVQETTEEEVTVAAEIDSFSLFAVAEIDADDSNTETGEDGSSSTNETEDESDGSSSDSFPGFGIASSIAALGSLGYLLKRRKS